jgi:2'-5' RNA ligase
MHLARHHATAFLNPHSSRMVEEVRRVWDPVMAQQIAAHITLIYPEEIADPAELIARAIRAAASTPPFSISVGVPIHAGNPADGVFLRVGDMAGGIRRFREAAVPAGHAIGFPPHVTIVHPRTSRHGEQAWNELAGLHVDARFTITEVAITAYDGQRWPTLLTIPLAGPQPSASCEESGRHLMLSLDEALQPRSPHRAHHRHPTGPDVVGLLTQTG